MNSADMHADHGCISTMPFSCTGPLLTYVKATAAVQANQAGEPRGYAWELRSARRCRSAAANSRKCKHPIMFGHMILRWVTATPRSKLDIRRRR